MFKDDSLKSSSRSILRYPGSKARLAPYIAAIVRLNNGCEKTFIEPFCGGASVSLALLEANVVADVILNDVDPLVASLWHCVFDKADSKWLAEKVEKAPLTLSYWRYQKSLNPKSRREAAFKCLYLNRTSFSGVLHKSAGPVGGVEQKNWTVASRFNKIRVAQRIEELSRLSSGVRSVTNQSWLRVCNKWNKRNALFYLDPPFFYKADRLYRYTFDMTEHEKLHKFLSAEKAPWILSYDNADEIRDMYIGQKLEARIVDNTYSANPIGGNSFIGREVLFSNCKLPVAEKAKGAAHQGLSIMSYGSKTAEAGLRLALPRSK